MGNKKVIVEKIKPQVFMVLFAIALFISSFRPNINYLTAEQIARDIAGIGPIKSQAIVMERTKGGVFKNADEFSARVKPYGVGKIVVEKAVKKYRIGE